MIGDNGLLSTLLGGLQMDAWLKNWIDEWDAQYEQMLTKKLQLTASASFTPTTDLKSENFRELAIYTEYGGAEYLSDAREIEVIDDEMSLPSEVRFGAGIGKPREWFVGAEYQVNIQTDLSS